MPNTTTAMPQTPAPVLTVIPAPLRVETGDGEGLTLADGVRVEAPAEWLGEVATVLDDIVGDGGPRLVCSTGPGAVTVRKVAPDALGDIPTAFGLRADGKESDERYRLTVSADAAVISAATAEGAFRGLTTLRQVLTASGESLTLPPLAIADGPRFAWRGLSLDVVRAFHPVEQVERVIDMLSLHKFNVLHLHLTDDQGWRFEVPGWPRLHELSDAGTPVGRPGGHYTDADVARLVAYGRARHVVLVPEVDLPGHATAVVAAYPELAGEATGPLPVLTAGTERVRDFLQAAITREAALFPDAAYLHIGADEAWGIAPDAYAAYVSLARELVVATGRRVLGWQEHVRASTTPDSVVQYWTEPDFIDRMTDSSDEVELPSPDLQEIIADHLALSAGDLDAITAQGAAILLSPTSQVYLDRPILEVALDPEQEARRARLGLRVYPPLALADIVTRDPMESVPGVDPSRVVGVEAAMWCETVTDGADLEMLLMPRLAGVSEVSWGATRAWADHRASLDAQTPAWDRRGWGYLRT